MSRKQIRPDNVLDREKTQDKSPKGSEYLENLQDGKSQEDNREDEWSELNYDQYNYGIYAGWI